MILDVQLPSVELNWFLVVQQQFERIEGLPTILEPCTTVLSCFRSLYDIPQSIDFDGKANHLDNMD